MEQVVSTTAVHVEAPVLHTPSAEPHYLTDVERKSWQDNGELPERFANNEKPEPPSDDPLHKLSYKQREEWRETGELPEEKPAQAESTRSVELSDEPKAVDDIWEGSADSKVVDSFRKRVETNIEQGLSHLGKLSDRAQVEAGLSGMFVGRDAQYQDFATALAEIKNPGAVLEHLGRTQEDRQLLMDSPNWQTLRYSVHQLSRALEKTKAAMPVTKAPRPISEVGGRDSATEDPAMAAVRSGDVRRTFQEWNRQAVDKFKRGY